MTEKEILTLVTALGAPILVFIGGLISWFLKTRKEDLQAVEERAIEKRIETYNKLLHPLILMFSNIDNKKMIDKAVNEIKSTDYGQAGFNLITFGSDEMVRSYNNMMQSFYKGESETDPKATMAKFADFLLSIRKDVYNKDTKLDKWDTLKFMITDIENLIEK